MQLRFGFCELCRSLLVTQPRTEFISTAKINLYAALSTRVVAVPKKRFRSKDNFSLSNVNSAKQEKKALRISCKRPEFNLYKGHSYEKFENIPLTSKGWHHRKSRGDYFVLERYQKNPSLSNSEESSSSFGDIGVQNDLISILENLNITKPTNIQVDGIPTLLRGRNTLLTAETGCGKTLAYLVPLVQQILSWKSLLKEQPFNSPLGIIVSPSRELANQIGEVAKQFSKTLPFKTQVLTGGHTKRKIVNPSYEEIDLLVASLGALSKLTTTGIYNIKNVHHIVLDEADTLLDDTFNEKLCHFLRRFQFQFKGAPNVLPSGVQLTLVSATLPTSMPEILNTVVAVESLVRVTSSQVHQLQYHVPQKFYRLGLSQKPGQLLTLVKNDVAKKAPVIIFSNKSSTCDWISMFLNENGVSCVNLNGKMLFDIRTGKLNRFQSGDVNVLSCTDIASRGIDTIRVKHVINYNFPLYMADYIHRCGRTGRVGSVDGCHVSNLVSTSREVELVQKIELAARKMDELPNVNANIRRTIIFRAMKKAENALV